MASALILGLLFSCAPKDQKLNRPIVPAKDGPNATVSFADSKADNYRHLAVLVERQSEVIQLFKVLTDSDYAAKKMFKVEDVEINSVHYKNISAQIENFSPLNSITNRVSLRAIVLFDENKNIQTFVISEILENLSFQSIVKIQDKSDLILKNKTKKIIIDKSLTDDSYNASYYSIDEANIKAGKTLLLNSFKFNFSKVKDVETDSYKINFLEEINHSRYGVQTADFLMQATQINLISTINDKCVSLSGHLALSSKELDKTGNNPLYTRDLTFNDSSLILKAGLDTYNLKGAPCSERPVVDLTRLF